MEVASQKLEVGCQKLEVGKVEMEKNKKSVLRSPISDIRSPASIHQQIINFLLVRIANGKTRNILLPLHPEKLNINGFNRINT